MKFSRYNVWAEIGDQVGLYSGMSGGFTVMSRQERVEVEAFVAGDHDGAGYAELLEKLVRMRALGSDDHDELGELRQRYDQSRWCSDALGYTVVTSLGCNFDCPYCFEDKVPSLLKPAVADALVGILHDSLSTIGRLSVTWMGGEPLLGKSQLLALSDRFIEVCDANGKDYSASLITNGWYLDGPTAQALAARRVSSAQVTIDGPPDVHDLTRPHLNGGPTFARILANVQEACDHLDIRIRINVDTTNAHRADELLAVLVDAGLAGRVSVGLGKITDAFSQQAAPLATYQPSCLTARDFGEYEIAFTAIAETYGFGYPGPPRPTSSPCTAVRAGEIVVGSDGELWKCWDDIGDQGETIGTVFDYHTTNDKLEKWLRYHPADDPQCSTCIAMPGCMGGCAHHEFNSDDREARCGAFRHNHTERVTELLRRAAGLEPGVLPELPRYDAGPPATATPVTLTARPRRAPVPVGA